MSLAARLARRLIAVAARRWPPEFAADLEREWSAELDALRGQPRRMLTFAASLAVSPAVDAPPWRERGRAVATPVALTLLAAALFNGVQLAKHHLGPVAAITTLGAAVAVMAAAGRRCTPGRIVLLGAALYAFLLAGNQVAVMPFMGWRDVGPAVAAWTAMTAVTVRFASHRLVAVAGILIAVDVAVAAGSLHAAGSLGVPASSAPLWLPLALLPGGAAGSASPALIGNAAAMAGPLTLCSAYVLAGLLRTRAPRPLRLAGTPAGVTAALLTVAAAEVLRHSGPTGATTAHRLAENSAVFGFGFLSHPAGLAVSALLVALLAAYREPAHR